MDFYRGLLSPRRLENYIQNLPPGAALYRAIDSTAAWTEEAHFLALVLDAQQMLLWSKTKDGQKNVNRPKPTPRPGVKPPGEEKWGGDAIEIDEMDRFLGWST